MRTPFGQVLFEAARELYGSSKELATHLSVGEPAVSRYLTRRSITSSTLDTILNAFPDPVTKQRLYDAWQETCAAPPELASVPELGAGDGEIIDFARRVHEFIAAGGGQFAFAALSRIWAPLFHSDRPLRVRFEIGEALAHAAFSVNRPVVGLPVVIELAEMGRRESDPFVHASALWLQAVGFRQFGRPAIEQAERRLEQATQVIENWNPPVADLRKARAGLVAGVTRDSVLTSWDRCRFDVGHEGQILLEARTRSLQAVTSWSADEPSPLALEVEARALTSLGRYEAANEALTAAKRLAPVDPLMRVKRGVSRARLFLAEGYPLEALNVIGKGIAVCDHLGLVHYRNELTAIEAEAAKLASGP